MFDIGAEMTQLHEETTHKLGFTVKDDTVRNVTPIGVSDEQEEGYSIRVPKLFVLGSRLEDVEISVLA